MAAQESERGAVMGKLVRDRIPEIIKKDGNKLYFERKINNHFLCVRNLIIGPQQIVGRF